MTGDVRDRILALLSAGPASVGRLATGLGVPGGVVNYELKLLERDGLVRVGTTRREHGVPTPVYVSTAAAAPPALHVPSPLPGLTWLADEPYPTPLWTVPHLPESPEPLPTASTRGADAGATRPAAGGASGAVGEPFDAEPAEPDLADEFASRITADFPSHTGISFPTRPRRPGATLEPTEAGAAGQGSLRAFSEPGQGSPHASSEPREAPAPSFPLPPQPHRFDRPDAESSRGPRLHDMRRVPMDDATFYEFAERLDALIREFAARATPGAPATELTILLTRPDGDPNTGYGS